MKKKSAQANAKVKALRSSSLMLLLSFALLLGSISFAWFSKNLQTESSGMQMSAGATPNLIIGSSADAVTSPDRDSNLFAVTWTTGRESMLCCTHDSATTATTYLKYVTNTVDVGLTSGLAKPDTTLQYNDVDLAEDNDSEYYIDFVVYLGSMDVALENVSLAATMSGARVDTTTTSDLTDTQLASSVDFYLGEATAANYKGTLNLAGAMATTPASVTLLDTGSMIPCCTAEGGSYLTVIMRCYFDGELKKDANSAYINTYNVDTSALSLSVFFTAEEDTSTP